MTRLIKPALDDDEALADWCEAAGPPPENEISVADYFLRCAVEDGESEQHLAERVAAALSAGTSWVRVADILGVSVGEAERRFANLNARTSPRQS